MKALLVGLLLAQFAPQHVGTEPLDPEREARVQRLGHKYRCPVCQGVSIAESGSPSARAQMDKLRDLVRAGQTDAQINDYFKERYGEWAELEPEMSHWGLWFGPGILLVVGFFIIAAQVKRKGKVAEPTQGSASASGEAAAKDAAVADYLAAVRAELDK